MASNLSSADQQLTAEQQAEIQRLKEQYAQYQAAGDKDGMDAAHKAAEDIRANAGYSGGSDGSGYVLLSGQTQKNNNQTYNKSYQTVNNGVQTNNAATGDANLSADLQAEIARLKEEYARAQAAGDAEGMNAAHAAAEKIRNSAGYTGGADGGQYSKLPTVGGASAADVQKWLDDYWYTNYDSKNGWVNGFSGQMNQRSMANYIRQQMEANSKAWANADEETRAYLHQQNLELAEILRENSGGTKSTYDPKTGLWSTANANLGYGVNVGQYRQADLEDWYKNFAGMTDEQIDAYRNDTARYRNYVDQNLIRNWVDESSGYTGVYGQFVNGPYGQLLEGDNPSIVNPTVYTDVQGDGFNERGYTPVTDADGNIVPQAPALKNNNSMDDYTRQFASYVDENGIIQPGLLRQTNPAGNARPADNRTGNGSYSGNTTALGGGSGYKPSSGAGYTEATDGEEFQAYLEKLAALGSGSGGSSGGGSGTSGGGTFGSSYFSNLSAPSTGGDLSDYINQMYDASLKSQLAQLEAAYQENLLELDKNQTETDAQYNEQKRQTQGESERSAANWRELAIAQGLNTGAVGQASLAQNNQLQNDLNTLSTAQAKALDDIRNQRTLLGKQYQLQILQAQADNDMERAQMLYQEAVRMDEVLMQKEEQAMQMMQTLLGYAASSSGSSGSTGSSGGSTGNSGGYSGGSGSSAGSSSGSSASAAALGSDAFNQSIREQANLNGQSASDYIYANYKALGIPYSQISSYVNSYNTWDNANRMSDSEFTMYLYTLQQLAKANQTERVYSQIEQNMNNLSASQQAQVEAFLKQWGKG